MRLNMHVYLWYSPSGLKEDEMTNHPAVEMKLFFFNAFFFFLFQ